VATYQGERAEVSVPLPGRHVIVAALAGLGSARALGVPLEEAAVALSTLERPRHRMEVRAGDRITVIDDSYNASPAAVTAALDVLREVRARRIAVIGDMLELGTLSADAHEEVGREAARSTDVLIGVGPLARTSVEAAKRAGLRETHSVADGAEALVLLKRLQRPGDVILVKGSHSLALDRLADALVRPVAV
jgi:UDP-N-acetylmuramoyl-tripeptide--D-alanyl-D-alanine ligase